MCGASTQPECGAGEAETLIENSCRAVEVSSTSPTSPLTPCSFSPCLWHSQTFLVCRLQSEQALVVAVAQGTIVESLEAVCIDP